MGEIYPDVRARSALTVFQIYEGTGEWFDLSKLPINRTNFSFGGAQAKEKGYFVTDKCIGCKLCYSKCPQKCIDITQKPVIIRQEHCLHCGNCFETCLQGPLNGGDNMTQEQRVDYLIRYLLEEGEEYPGIIQPSA